MRHEDVPEEPVGLILEIDYDPAAGLCLFRGDPRVVPFPLRFGHPEPGLQGAISYARFVGRKTGGLIRIRERGGRVRVESIPIQTL